MKKIKQKKPKFLLDDVVVVNIGGGGMQAKIESAVFTSGGWIYNLDRVDIHRRYNESELKKL